jgi:hypothetical protein
MDAEDQAWMNSDLFRLSELELGLPARVQSPRYPVLLVVPISSDRGEFWVEKAPKLYPRLKARMRTFKDLAKNKKRYAKFISV